VLQPLVRDFLYRSKEEIRGTVSPFDLPLAIWGIYFPKGDHQPSIRVSAY
jgi:hypothetical protein